MCVCCLSFSTLIWTCVVWSQHGSRSLHQCVWVSCVLGVLCVCVCVCVWCGRGRKAALFCICVCVWTRLCVVWSKAEKRASVHMGTNDRIWFKWALSVKKMKETKLVKTGAETLPELLQRFHCSVRWSVDGHHFFFFFFFWSLHLPSKYVTYTDDKPNLGLVPNNTGEMQRKQKTTKLPSNYCLNQKMTNKRI